MIGLMAPFDFGLIKILAIIVPSTFVAILVMGFVQGRRGKELKDDPEFQERLKRGEVQKPSSDWKSGSLPEYAKRSVYIFGCGVIAVVLFALFPQLRPQIALEGGMESLGMSHLIVLIMFVVTVLIFLSTKIQPQEVPKTTIFRAGMVSILALFGVAWMANTFIEANRDFFVETLGTLAQQFPIFLALALFFFAAMTTSQSSTTLVLIPIGLTLGIAPAYVVAMWPAVIGIYFFPANGSQIATLQFDRSGTVKIGRFVLNHSFLLPTFLACGVTVGVGLLIAAIFF